MWRKLKTGFRGAAHSRLHPGHSYTSVLMLAFREPLVYFYVCVLYVNKNVFQKTVKHLQGNS